MKKIAIASFAGLAAAKNNNFLNIGGLIQDGTNAVSELTNGNPDLGNLINDGTAIYNDATGSSIPQLGGAVDQGVSALGGDPKLGDVYNDAKQLIGNQEFVNIANLINDGAQALTDATNGHPDAGNLVNDGTKIFNDATGKNIPQLGNAVDQVVGALKNVFHNKGKSTGSAAANQEFVNVAGLINDGANTINDITSGQSTVGSLINDGTSIYDDATGSSIPQVGNAVNNGINALGGDSNIGDLIGAAKSLIGGADNQEFVNINGLLTNGIQALEDATNGHPDAGNLDNDITGIVNAATGKNIPQTGKAVDAVVNAVKNLLKKKGTSSGAHAGSAGANQEFVNIAGLIQDGTNAVSELTNGNPDLGNLINDGTAIYNDATGSAIPQLGGAVDQGVSALGGDPKLGDVYNDAKQLIAGSNQEFVNVAGLINDGAQALSDATNGHPDAGNLVNDGTKIFNDATGKNIPQLGNAVDTVVGALKNIFKKKGSSSGSAAANQEFAALFRGDAF